MEAAAQQSVAPIINNNNNKIMERNLCGDHDHLPDYRGVYGAIVSRAAGPQFLSTTRCPAFRLHLPSNNAFDDRVFICFSRRMAVFKRTRNKRFWTTDSSMAPVHVVGGGEGRAGITRQVRCLSAAYAGSGKAGVDKKGVHRLNRGPDKGAVAQRVGCRFDSRLGQIGLRRDGRTMTAIALFGRRREYPYKITEAACFVLSGSRCL